MDEEHEEPRRTIMIPESFVKELEEMRKLMGAKDDSEVLRRSFALYRKLIPEEPDGVGT